MTDKLLFYIDKSFVHFGIAKFMQEKYKCEMYVIYDLNFIQKQTFQNQKLVDFKKSWFYQDHILRNKNPDLKYLEYFEKTYKIPIWVNAYNERLFYRYNKYYKFKYDEILSIFEQECRFFEEILDEIKPDFLVIRTTDWHRNHLLAEMCKTRGIHILMLNPIRFGNRIMISEEYDKFDNFLMREKRSSNIRSIEELRDFIHRFSSYKDVKKIVRKGSNVSIFEKVRIILYLFKIMGNKEYQQFYENYGKTAFTFLIKESFLLLKSRYRKFFIDRHFDYEINDKKFLYFTLGVEPERSSSIDAPFYTDQIAVIRKISKSLPVDCKLLVKEHPGMQYRSWRPISYYKQILAFPNVRLVHPSLKPEELLEHSSLVITIGGTSGLEAAFYNKPSIVFSDVLYSNLSSVTRIRNIEDLPQIIRTSLQKKVNLEELNQFVDEIESNSFDFDIVSIYNDLYSRFFYNGLLADAVIPMEKVERYLEDNHPKFEQLVTEHIKKITQIKENKSTLNTKSIDNTK